MHYASPSYSFNMVELPGHNILAGLAETHLLTPEGYNVQVSVYLNGGTNLTQSLKQVDENVFFFSTSTALSPCPAGTGLGDRRPVLGKMDSLANVLNMHSYELSTGPCSNSPAGLEVMGDAGVITWGRQHNFFALRAGADLSLIWCKRVNRSGTFNFIKELPDGDLLAGITMDTAGVVLARLNADGNFIWAKSYMRPKGIVHDALIEPDGSLIVTGFTDSTETTGVFGPPPPASFQPKLFMMKLDGAGEVQWCKGWKSPTNLWYTRRKSRIERSLDGKYVVMANLGGVGDHNRFRPFLMKTTPNGDTLWTRTVGREDYLYSTQDLLPYSDGGFLLSGIIYGDMPNGENGLMYIYKADSLGHFPCWEHVHSVETFDLFPVDSSLTLTAIDVPTTVAPVFVNDSILDPSIFTTYDGCTFTTGIDYTVHKGQSIRVRPNPNTGRFTVAFADPLMAESYYSVYDGLGKLLYQRPLPAGATTAEVDLSRYGPGTYVIKCTDKDGVSYERVVVE